jgi:hypothetical protein
MQDVDFFGLDEQPRCAPMVRPISTSNAACVRRLFEWTRLRDPIVNEIATP